MDSELPEGYISLEEAARIAKVSEKTVRNWADREPPSVGKQKWKGRALYNRADIEAQAARQSDLRSVQYGGPALGEHIAKAVETAFKQGPVLTVPTVSTELASIEQMPVAPADAGRSLAMFVEMIRNAPTLADLTVKRYLTFAEASQLDGRSKSKLRELAAAAKVIHEGIGPKGADLIERKDLEKL